MTKPAKPITTDQLAAMVQAEFVAARNEITDLRQETWAHFTALRHDLGRDIAESEERILAAVKGIEVKKNDFDALKHEVDELRDRVAHLEKRKAA